VTVGPPGSFLLVTGSNMSGKSTLLRTIGANAVLAGAGAPVCARALRLPPVAVWTSMHVEDSLEEGVSYFLAEVLRLKRVVEAARAAGEGDPLVCYLLDEVLRGTNTGERSVAAVRVLRVLAGQRAIGAVSTHDLTLGDAPDLAGVARPVHFRETVTAGGEKPAMTFDYLLRDGPATSTNALRLLELMGLALDRGD
jgi:DNA mismatch repair ATPase MutS